tara:strand:- start:3316 stop:4206 length:891 start_codon:yes stop_codon:yes gene_type:complete
MAFPTDILLPDNARYYTFIETKKNFNSNYDITWSFSYYFPFSSFQATPNYQLGFTTFITSLSYPISALPGQYLGDQDPEFILSANALYTEVPEVLKTEADSTILLESGILSGSLIKIAFDSTGFYALTGRDDRPGVGLETDCHRDALVIRDFDHNVIANAPLKDIAVDSVSTTFSTLSTDTWRTLRFRYINLGQKLHIDVRESETTTYSLLTTINLDFSLGSVANLDNIFVGFSLCTPISASTSLSGYALSAGNFYLRNFQIEGYEGATVQTETVTTPLLSVVSNVATTTVTNVTA